MKSEMDIPKEEFKIKVSVFWGEVLVLHIAHGLSFLLLQSAFGHFSAYYSRVREKRREAEI